MHAISIFSIHSTKQEGCGSITGDGVTMSLSVTLCGHLKCRKLRLLDLHTDSTLNCVTFDPTYYDTETSRYSWLVPLPLITWLQICVSCSPFINIPFPHAVPAHVHVVYRPKVCVRSKLLTTYRTHVGIVLYMLLHSHFRRVILYNDSPVATGFLCLLDTHAEGSEVGVDGREGVSMAYTEGGPGQGRWREQGDAPPAERLLRVEPAQVSRWIIRDGGHIFWMYECTNIYKFPHMNVWMFSKVLYLHSNRTDYYA